MAHVIAMKGSNENSPFQAEQWNMLSSDIDKIILTKPKRC